MLNTTRSGGHKFKVDAVTIRWERDDGGDAAAAARTAACRRMIRQDQIEQSELETSSAAKRLYLERCAVSAAGLALEGQDTPARPAPGSSLSYPGYCDKTQAGEGNCDVSNKGSLQLKPPEGLQVRPPPLPPSPVHPFTLHYLPLPSSLGQRACRQARPSHNLHSIPHLFGWRRLALTSAGRVRGATTLPSRKSIRTARGTTAAT